MDQLGAMRAFVRVVQTGSFSAAAREMNSGQANISKKVSALEAKLGVKLITRSSRELSLTEVGAHYLEKCIAILAELDEAESTARAQVATPSGLLRVTAPVALGRLLLAPHMNEFLATYPDIKIDLSLSDEHVDLIANGIDIAFRAKQLEDSSLVARHLFNNPMLLLATPEYLEAKGTPSHPNDLVDHNCLVYSMSKSLSNWSFYTEDRALNVNVSGNIRCDSGDVLLELALAHNGIVQLPIWMVNKELKEGKLIQLLQEYAGINLPFHAIYPQNRYVPLKVRCFVDFMKAKFQSLNEHH